MAIEKKIQGTGITAETVTSYSGQDIKEGADKFFTAIAQTHEEDGGDFGARTLPWIKVAESIKDEFEQESPDKDSMARFAQDVLRFHQIALAEQKRGDTDSAMRFAFELGVVVERWRMKCGWEDHALRGDKIIEAARKGHEIVHGDQNAKLKKSMQYRKDFDAELGRGTKKTAAYAIVAERHGVSAKTIQRHVKS